MRTKWKQDANYSKQMTEILRANGKKNKGRKNGPWTEKRTKKMIESVKKIRASEADKRKRREAKIFRDAQDQDVERQIWNYAKRNKLFKKIVEHGNLTHKQMGLLRKHFGKQRLEVPFGLLDTFTKAVANLA